MHRLQLQFLVPTDFTACSEEALREAVRAAESQYARITLLHVTRPMARPQVLDGLDSIGYLYSFGPGHQGNSALLDAPAVPAMSPQLREKFEQLLVQYRTDDLDLQYAWREGEVTEEILKYAADHLSNVIYLGVEPEGLPIRFFPDITDRILRKAVCRVIVVRGARPQAGS